MQKILIVEDHNDARREIRRIVGEAFEQPDIDDVATLAQARTKILAQAYDLVVLDLGLPDGNGEDFIHEILAQQPNAYVVISTIHDESDRLLAALENGAKGYLLKEQPSELLIEEFRGIQRGKPPLAPAVTRRLLEHMRASSPTKNAGLTTSLPLQDNTTNSAKTGNTNPPNPDDTGLREEADQISNLTDREKEILVFLAKGFNRPEIAGILGISKHTVATHVAKIYNKLDISSRSEATVIAMHHDLL